MKDSAGNPKYPVWLIADSEPKSWQELLVTPLDPRHPARHSIWTSVLEYMQAALYGHQKRRFATDNLYIMNAVKDPASKPNAKDVEWLIELKDKANVLKSKLHSYQPKIVITFGAFAFEFVRRAQKEEPQLPFGYWSTKRLGDEFRKRVASFDPSGINIIPLLHVSISRGRFLESHKYFVGEEGKEPPNYFKFVGTTLAGLLIRQCKELAIWISSNEEDKTS